MFIYYPRKPIQRKMKVVAKAWANKVLSRSKIGGGIRFERGGATGTK
jgi:hypothetical protein